jgi:hypothetical protein
VSPFEIRCRRSQRSERRPPKNTVHPSRAKLTVDQALPIPSHTVDRHALKATRIRDVAASSEVAMWGGRTSGFGDPVSSASAAEPHSGPSLRRTGLTAPGRDR